MLVNADAFHAGQGESMDVRMDFVVYALVKKHFGQSSITKMNTRLTNVSLMSFMCCYDYAAYNM